MLEFSWFESNIGWQSKTELVCVRNGLRCPILQYTMSLAHVGGTCGGNKRLPLRQTGCVSLPCLYVATQGCY
jgi:hypothetical protein